MIEQEAQVTGIDGTDALVAVQRQSSCGSCAAKSGCGTSVVASMFPQRQQRLRLANTIDAVAGDRVIIGLPEAGLQRASLLLYGAPLLGLLCGAALGQQWGGSEPHAILGGLLGIVLGLGLVRQLGQRGIAGQPVLLRRLSPPSVTLVGLQPGPP